LRQAHAGSVFGALVMVLPSIRGSSRRPSLFSHWNALLSFPDQLLFNYLDGLESVMLKEKDLSGRLVFQIIMWHTEDKAIILYSEVYTD